MNNKIKRKTGSANMIAAKPLITAMLTALWPTHKPNIYFKPCRQPNAAPVPASDKTPGPGVMQSNNTAKMNVNISAVYMDFFLPTIVKISLWAL